MHTGFVVIKKNVVVTSKRRGKREYAAELTLTLSEALRKVFEYIPAWVDVAKLPHSDSRGELLKTIRQMYNLRRDLSAFTPLVVTLKERDIIERLLKDVPLHSLEEIYRAVGEYFADEKKRQVTRFLWDFYALNCNAWSRTYDVRSDIKCEEDGLDMSTPELMSALSAILPSQEEMMTQAA